MITDIRCLACDHDLDTSALDDDACPTCGIELDDFAIESLTIARVVAVALADSAAAPVADPAPIIPGMLYGLRESSMLLRVDRSVTLRRAIDAALIRAVRVGRAQRIPGAELLRVLREGLPRLPDARRPPAPTKAKRRARKTRDSNGSITDIPL